MDELLALLKAVKDLNRVEHDGELSNTVVDIAEDYVVEKARDLYDEIARLRATLDQVL